MAALFRLAIVLAACSVVVRAERWRAIAKAVRRCDGPTRTVELMDVKLSYTNKGEIFKADLLVDIAEHVKLTLIDVQIFKNGGARPLKFLTWQYDNPCKTIKEGHPYINPLFESNQIPQECEFDKRQIVANVTYDLHGEIQGASFRGDYIQQIKFYTGNKNLVFCTDVYGIIKKNTLTDGDTKGIELL